MLSTAFRMVTFVSILHVVLSVFMIFVILLQPGKDAGMGAALGGGAATSAFGGRGAVTFLTKLTAACAIGFFLTCLGLSFVGLKTTVVSSFKAPAAAPAAPALPGATPAVAVPAAAEAQPSTPTATQAPVAPVGGAPASPAEPARAKGTEGVP